MFPLIPLLLSLTACGLRSEAFRGNAIAVASQDSHSAEGLPADAAVCVDEHDAWGGPRHVIVRLSNQCDLTAKLVESRYQHLLVIDPGQTCVLPLGGTLTPMRVREGSGTLTLGGDMQQLERLDVALGADTTEVPPRFVSYRFSGASLGRANEATCPGRMNRASAREMHARSVYENE